jgi:hypothetical protein
MATFDDALAWLNQYDAAATHIVSAGGIHLKSTVETQPLELPFSAHIENYLDEEQSQIDPLERPEARLYLVRGKYALADHWQKIDLAEAAENENAVLPDTKQLLLDARENIAEAISAYADDDHRRAIVHFISGLVEWKVSQHYLAFIQWRKAHDLFSSLRQYHLMNNHIAEADWYQKRLADVSMALCGTIEEAYSWLNLFRDEAQLVTGPVLDLKKMISAKFTAFEHAGIDGMISELQKLGNGIPDYQERAEIYAFCGFSLHKIGQYREAKQNLQRAEILFQNGSHKQAVTRWMKGITQWCVVSEQSGAIASWQKSIQNLAELRNGAVNSNNPAKAQWYRESAEWMRSVLSERTGEIYR